MRKIFILASVLLCVLFLASCNITDKINALSDQIKTNIIDVAGQFIEKDTSKGQSNSSDSSDAPSHTEQVPSVPDEPSVPDIPDVPTQPELPEYLLLERVKYPLNKYVGINIDDNEYKHRNAYGYGRYSTTLENAINSNNLSYFRISDMESAVQIDFDLALAKKEAGEGEISFRDIASLLGAFAEKFSSPSALLYNTTRIEIGSCPNEKISPKDYALLLNTIYDGSNKELAGIGTTFINPEIRLITGTMSKIELDYIKELMSELEALRQDAYIPVGGWSFEIRSEGKAPETALSDYEQLNDLVKYRNKNYNGIEIYLNGIGWDTVNEDSPNYVAPKNGYTSEELQAMYILRAFLIANYFDIDKLTLSTLKDTEDNGEGIISANGTRKLSYNLLEYFKAKTANMSFVDVKSFMGEFTALYQDGNGNTMCAIWTNNASITMELEGLPESITVATYDKDSGTYKEEPVTTAEGAYSLTVNDMPTFIFYN